MRALLVVLIIAALIIGFIFYTFPALFKSNDHSATKGAFLASIPTIFRTSGGNLELAGLNATETFMQSDTAKMPYFNFNIPGATTTVIITVPVVYRYHVRVLETWDIDIVENICYIYAPELLPTLPPAIQSDKMQIKTFEGPLAFNGAEQQAKLMQSITPQLERYAQDSTRLNFIRDEARKTVAEFVQAWLLQRGEWGERKIDKIQVSFRGEEPANINLRTAPAETPNVDQPNTER